MKKFSESLREHVMEINSFEKKKTWLLTKKSSRNHMKTTKSCLICKEKFENKYVKDKKYSKVRDYCHNTEEYRGAVDSICNLKYSVPKKIPIDFCNGSNYDYHFIIKELLEEFGKQFTCLGENT